MQPKTLVKKLTQGTNHYLFIQ